MVEKRIRIIIKGKVQGVYFRDLVKQNANKLGVVGYVKNLKNGGLEIVAQGDDSKLDILVKLCKSGPIFAKVESLSVSDGDIGASEEFTFFDVRPT